MKKLRILAEARQEFADALRWYRRQAPAFAEALALEYRQIVRHAREFPDAGAVEAASHSITVRRFLFHQFPYKVLIVNLADQIVVVAFAHTKRKPGYWLKRIP
jgi:plasmid stabilization system protein ParE